MHKHHINLKQRLSGKFGDSVSVDFQTTNSKIKLKLYIHFFYYANINLLLPRHPSSV